MFLVFNKEKIYSYAVAVFTVAILFFVATNYAQPDTIQTSSNMTKKVPIYNVELEQKKVSLTMNCAWAWSQLRQIEK